MKMSKLLVSSIASSVWMVGCSSEPSPTGQSMHSEASQVQEAEPKSRPKPTETQSIELRLLKELDSFKDSSSFRSYGFGRGGPHYGWLNKVRQAKKAKDIDVKTKISLGELETLGQEYQRSGGQETENTRWFRKRVLDPFGDD